MIKVTIITYFRQNQAKEKAGKFPAQSYNIPSAFLIFDKLTKYLIIRICSAISA